jgi:hypothetical protein
LRVHARDQRRQFRACDMIADADADGEALPCAGKYSERAAMHLQEFTRGLEKGCAVRRQLHVPRRSLDSLQPIRFEPLELQADSSLRRLHGFGCEREAPKLDDDRRTTSS